MTAAIGPLKPYLRGTPPGLPFRFDSRTIAAGLNFTLTTEHGPLDLLGEIGGVGGYPEVLAESEPQEVFGLTIRVLSLDGLIAAKKAAGRSKDHIHLLELRELKKHREAGNREAFYADQIRKRRQSVAIVGLLRFPFRSAVFPFSRRRAGPEHHAASIRRAIDSCQHKKD